VVAVLALLFFIIGFLYWRRQKEQANKKLTPFEQWENHYADKRNSQRPPRQQEDFYGDFTSNPISAGSGAGAGAGAGEFQDMYRGGDDVSMGGFGGGGNYSPSSPPTTPGNMRPLSAALPAGAFFNPANAGPQMAGRRTSVVLSSQLGNITVRPLPPPAQPKRMSFQPSNEM